MGRDASPILKTATRPWRLPGGRPRKPEFRTTLVICDLSGNGNDIGSPVQIYFLAVLG